MSNKNARVIIPLAIGVWLLSILAFAAGLPSAVAAALTVVLIGVMFVGVPLIVFYLIAETGWSRRKVPRPGVRRPWVMPTGLMARRVHSDIQHPGPSRKVLRVGTTDALLSTLFTRSMMGCSSGRRCPWRDITVPPGKRRLGFSGRPPALSPPLRPEHRRLRRARIGEPRVPSAALILGGASQLSLEPAS
jgi:hypothetical protein